MVLCFLVDDHACGPMAHLGGAMSSGAVRGTRESVVKSSCESRAVELGTPEELFSPRGVGGSCPFPYNRPRYSESGVSRLGG